MLDLPMLRASQSQPGVTGLKPLVSEAKSWSPRNARANFLELNSVLGPSDAFVQPQTAQRTVETNLYADDAPL